MRACCVAALLSLGVTGCTAEPEEQYAARVAIAERHGLTPRDLAVRNSGALVVSVWEAQPNLRAPEDRARLARALACELSRRPQNTARPDSVAVRFVRLGRSDLRTFRFVTSYSFSAAELLAGEALDGLATDGAAAAACSE
jgi:hypothetical protein